MADPDSQELLLKRALAQYLEDQGAGVYRSDGTSYTAGERAILTNGPTLPTTLDDCIVLASRRPIPDGRANLVFPIDVYTRMKDPAEHPSPSRSLVLAQNAGAFVSALIDQKSNVPPGMNISWAWSFSRLDIGADSNVRCAVAETFYLRGRRLI